MLICVNGTLQQIPTGRGISLNLRNQQPQSITEGRNNSLQASIFMSFLQCIYFAAKGGRGNDSLKWSPGCRCLRLPSKYDCQKAITQIICGDKHSDDHLHCWHLEQWVRRAGPGALNLCLLTFEWEYSVHAGREMQTKQCAEKCSHWARWMLSKLRLTHTEWHVTTCTCITVEWTIVNNGSVVALKAWSINK